MKKNFTITVTHNIEGGCIEKYIDTICTNVVLGTNVFSDIVASFSDFFGGFSGTYRNKLELIYDEAKKGLMKKAQDMGANAIVGFNVDFDEISGGGKSMFMISASGTACVIKKVDNDNENSFFDRIPNEILDIELKKFQIKKRLTQGWFLDDEAIQFLMEHPIPEIVRELLNIYLMVVQDNEKNGYITYEGGEKILNFVPEYVKLLPVESILNHIYTTLENKPARLNYFVKTCNLFSTKHILELAKKNIHSAISLLDTSKNFYTKEDIEQLKEILNVFDSMPDTGQIKIQKSGILRKEEEKFICECGHVNNKEKIFCKDCGVNIKGLRKEEIDSIENFRDKITVLSSLFS